ARQLGVGGRLGGLLHDLLVLLEQVLRVLGDAPDGLELLEPVEHLLQLVGDRLLVLLRLLQRVPRRVDRPLRAARLARTPVRPRVLRTTLLGVAARGRPILPLRRPPARLRRLRLAGRLRRVGGLAALGLRRLGAVGRLRRRVRLGGGLGEVLAG